MIRQPKPKADVLARRAAIVAGLRALLPVEAVIAEPLRLKPYETDGLPAYRQLPLAVVLPDTTEQVAAVMHFCHQQGVRVVPRGAGTSLSGGALPMVDAVVVGLMRMNRILDIDYADRCATVQAGVTNIGITDAVQGRGFFYAPDPSSQLAGMSGGNVNMAPVSVPSRSTTARRSHTCSTSLSRCELRKTAVPLARRARITSRTS